MRKKQPGALTPEAFFSFSWRNTAVCIGILAAATGLCFLLRLLDDSDVYVALIFELAVVLVSRFTSGYFYGLLASVVGVIGVKDVYKRQVLRNSKTCRKGKNALRHVFLRKKRPQYLSVMAEVSLKNGRTVSSAGR